MDAAILIYDLELLKQARSILDRAAEMILIAATTGAAADIHAPTSHGGDLRTVVGGTMTDHERPFYGPLMAAARLWRRR